MHVCMHTSAFIQQFLSCAQLFRRAVPPGIKTNRIQVFLWATGAALPSSSLALWEGGQQPWHITFPLAGQPFSLSWDVLFAGIAALSQVLLSGHYGSAMVIADGGNM